MLDRLKRSRPAVVLQAYGASQAGNYAAGLAMNAFMAMFPLILGILAVAGVVIRDPAMQQHLQNAVASIFPSEARPQVLQALGGVKRAAGVFGIISVLGLLWSGTSLFAAMEFALTKIFGSKQRDTLRQRLMGLIMVVIFVTAVILSVVLNSAAAASAGFGVIGAVLGAAVLVALLIALYRFVPNRTFPLGEIWPGALLAGVLIEVFTLAFPLYAKLSHGFNTYGQQFALFFVLATWLMFLSQFILLGAVFNKVRLGAPVDEGVVPSPASKSRDAQEPAEAIDEKAADAEHGGDADLRGRGVVHPTPREARVALGAGAAVAAVGAFLGRTRRR